MSNETPPISFEPLGDQVLIKLDTLPGSVIINPKHAAAAGGVATALPSGIVIAVGAGVWVPGSAQGWIPIGVKVGDHVAIDQNQPWHRLPLSNNPDEYYVSVSQGCVMGRLTGASKDSAWFKAKEDERGALVVH